MRETFIRSQRTQSLQNKKERMDAREKTEGKNGKLIILKKCLTEKRTEGHRSYIFL